MLEHAGVMTGGIEPRHMNPHGSLQTSQQMDRIQGEDCHLDFNGRGCPKNRKIVFFNKSAYFSLLVRIT